MFGGVTCEELGCDAVEVLPVKSWDVMLWKCYLWGAGMPCCGGVTCGKLGRNVVELLPMRSWDVMLWSCYL